MSNRRRIEDFIDLTDDEVEERPMYSRLRRAIEESDDEVLSISSDDSYDSIDDFIVPDEIMMDVDGEENAGLELEEVLTKYRRDPTRRIRTELEVTLGSKYSQEPVYEEIPPYELENSAQLAEVGKMYYRLYDKNKPSWSTMTDDVERYKTEAMQYYIYAAYCYRYCDTYDRAWMISNAQSKSAGNELLRVYRIIEKNPLLLHYPGLTKSAVLRFK